MDFDAEDDPTCRRTYAMLLVSGDNIANEEFTRRLGILPSESGIAGDCSCWKLEFRVPIGVDERRAAHPLDSRPDS